MLFLRHTGFLSVQAFLHKNLFHKSSALLLSMVSPVHRDCCTGTSGSDADGFAGPELLRSIPHRTGRQSPCSEVPLHPAVRAAFRQGNKDPSHLQFRTSTLPGKCRLRPQTAVLFPPILPAADKPQALPRSDSPKDPAFHR